MRLKPNVFSQYTYAVLKLWGGGGGGGGAPDPVITTVTKLWGGWSPRSPPPPPPPPPFLHLCHRRLQITPPKSYKTQLPNWKHRRKTGSIVANLPKPKDTSVKKVVKSVFFMVIIANVRWRDNNAILISLEGQPLKKWDCPSEIETVGNYARRFDQSSP